MNAMLWIAAGCLIAGFLLLVLFYIGAWRASRNSECAMRYARVRTALMIGYLLFFIAAAVLFIIG